VQVFIPNLPHLHDRHIMTQMKSRGLEDEPDWTQQGPLIVDCSACETLHCFQGKTQKGRTITGLHGLTRETTVTIKQCGVLWDGTKEDEFLVRLQWYDLLELLREFHDGHSPHSDEQSPALQPNRT